jgi:TonB family protein
MGIKFQMKAYAMPLVVFLLSGLWGSTACNAQASDSLFAAGYELIRAGDPKAAVAKFETGLKADPNNALAHYYLGKAYLALGRSGEARAQFRKSLRLDPNGSVSGPAREELSRLPAPAVAAAPANPESAADDSVPEIGKAVPAILPMASVPSFVDSCPYPSSAVRRGDTGTTVVLVLVGPDGAARKVMVDASSGSSTLDDAVVRCVLDSARFSPRQRGAKAISYWGRMSMHWVLQP